MIFNSFFSVLTLTVAKEAWSRERAVKTLEQPEDMVPVLLFTPRGRGAGRCLWQPLSGGRGRRLAAGSGSSAGPAVPKGRLASPSTAPDGAWFPHLGLFHSQPELITDHMLKQIQNPEEVWYIEKTLPVVYKIWEQKAVKNHFPFSTHDNRNCLQNVGEYFDFVSIQH
ncbi:testis-expressed protein 36 [Dermochelys coriacea]|uniref:testis-expressed protein 36 n=1 Tax=Dermochelys coriacea TaxID=27794 RepID=UPI001CA84FFC|nr:testis-expressed protein 36 [Dermochelys coriacea]